MKVAKGQLIAGSVVAMTLAWGMVGNASATTGARLYCTYESGTSHWVDSFLRTPTRQHCPATSTRGGLQGILIDEEVVD